MSRNAAQPLGRAQPIPRHSWPDFAQSFAQQHKGWLVSLTRSDGETTRVIADELPLEAIRVDRRDDSDIFEIAVGDLSDTHLHHLQGVKEVRIISSASDPTAIERLELDADGQSLTLRFRTMIAPELVDGLPGGIK